MSLLEQLTEIALENKKRIHEEHEHCIVSYIFVKGKEVYFCDNHACYFQMQKAAGAPWTSGITGIVSGIKDTPRVTKEQAREWIKFHLEDKVFGTAILSKDLDWIMEHNLIISDTTAAGNLMQGVLVSIRQIWEYNQIVTSYYHLVKGGVMPLLAYNLAHFLYYRDDRFEFNVYGPGHNLFYGNCINARHMKNWFEGKLHNARAPYIEESEYTGTSTMFGSDDTYRSNRETELMVRKIFGRIGKEENTTNKNPFSKAKIVAKVDSWNVKLLTKFVVENQDQIIKELTNA